MTPTPTTTTEPGRDCALCPRLAAHRRAGAAAHPHWHNAPVPDWGPPGARLLVLGLAPGRKGANRTGRVFTGDGSGTLLFENLARTGFAHPDATPRDCLITNAVRCLPPANRPTAQEIATCSRFLRARLAAMERLTALLCLGRIAHEAALGALDVPRRAHPFAHGAIHRIGALTLFDSYHPSRYNLNTGRLTPAMFAAVFDALAAYTGPEPARVKETETT